MGMGASEFAADLGEYVEKLREVCVRRGYDVEVLEDSGGGMLLKMFNPTTSGTVKMIIDGKSWHGLDVDLGGLLWRGGAEGKKRKIKQMKLQLEILAEELSQSGLSLRDELSARLMLYGLITGFKIPNFIWKNWRSCATIARMALEWGMQFEMKHSSKGFPIISLKGPDKNIRRFIEEYERTYKIDGFFVADLVTIIKKGRFASVLKSPKRRRILSEYFPPKVYALFALKAGNLTNRDYEALRNALFNSQPAERQQITRTIIDEHVYSNTLSREELRRIEDILVECVDKKFGKLEIIRILNDRWSLFFVTRDVNAEVILPRFLKKSLEKVLGMEIEGIFKSDEGIEEFVKFGESVLRRREPRGGILNILTKDGYQIFLSMGKVNNTLYLRSRNRLFRGVYTSLTVAHSNLIKRGHIELINKFLEKSKLYIKRAMKLAREEFDENIIKMAVISEDDVTFFAPPVGVVIDTRESMAKNAEKIRKIEKTMRKSLKSLEIAAGDKLLPAKKMSPAKKYVKI